LGQLYAGQIRWSAYFLGAWAAFLALLFTPLPSTFPGFAFAYLGLMAVNVATFLHAGVVAWREPVIERRPYHRWYVYVAYVAGASQP
jgi:hypothetical protein